MNKMNLRRLIFHVKTYIHAMAKNFIMRKKKKFKEIENQEIVFKDENKS